MKQHNGADPGAGPGVLMRRHALPGRRDAERDFYVPFQRELAAYRA
ncbi:MAG TPA: hypothetical protein VF265_02215 [Nevskiaceae bacterium]